MLKPFARLVSTLGLCALASAVLAQELPSVIKVVVPFAPGAGTDVAARTMALQLGPRIGKTVIVENRPGASTRIAVEAVLSAPHDGSTLLFSSSSLVSAAATLRDIRYDVARDLLPIAIVSDGPMVVVVSQKSGIKTPADLVARARANPDKLTGASAGVGSIGHLAIELLNEAAKVRILHVPYKGSAPAMTDVAAGNVDLHIASYTTVASQLQAGRVIAIAVTSAQPNPAFQGLPTLGSAAPGYSASIWFGLFAPAGTPRAIVERLSREVNQIAKTPEFGKLLQADGASPLTAGIEELQKFVREDFARWKDLARAKNIVVD